MRQAVEAQVLTSHCALGEHGLRQILLDVIEEVRHSIHKDIDGAEVLDSLLNAPWLHSLLKVYECLQRFKQEQPSSYLNYASGLSLQLVLDIVSLPDSSEEAQELCRLLKQPHFQALLSAHDTVSQKDYDPVLPPMPEELPEHEEATRVVCLVKNKQPLPWRNRSASSSSSTRLQPCVLPPIHRNSISSTLDGLRGQWASLKRLTQRRLSVTQRRLSVLLLGDEEDEEEERPNPNTRAGPPPILLYCPPPPPPPPPRYYGKPTGGGGCSRVCFRSPGAASSPPRRSTPRRAAPNSPWAGEGRSRASPSGSSSRLMDDADSLDLDSPPGSARSATYCTPPYCTRTCHHPQPNWSVSPPAQPPRRPSAAAAGYYCYYYSDLELQPSAVPPCCGFPTRSFCVRTAPPSPMLTPRHRQGWLGGSSGVLAAGFPREEEPGQSAAARADSRRTRRPSESAWDNTRALSLLARAVERLQGLVESRMATLDGERRGSATAAAGAAARARSVQTSPGSGGSSSVCAFCRGSGAPPPSPDPAAVAAGRLPRVRGLHPGPRRRVSHGGSSEEEQSDDGGSSAGRTAVPAAGGTAAQAQARSPRRRKRKKNKAKK